MQALPTVQSSVQLFSAIFLVALTVAVPAAAEDDGKKPAAGVDFLTNANLLKYGVTFGLAASMQVARERGSRRHQNTTSVAPMPYVIVAPTYWFLHTVNKEFCATRALSTKYDVAQAQADARAVAIAERRWESDRTRYHASCSVPAGLPAGLAPIVQAHCTSSLNQLSGADRTAVRAALAQPDEASTKEVWDVTRNAAISCKLRAGAAKPDRKAARDELKKSCHRSLSELDRETRATVVLAYSGWELGVPGKCWRYGHWAGLYAGFPLKYSANFDVNGQDRAVDVRPLGSVGFAFIPSPYLTAMIGITRLAVRLPEEKMMETVVQPARDAGSWVWTVSFGGNIDLLTKLLTFGMGS